MCDVLPIADCLNDCCCTDFQNLFPSRSAKCPCIDFQTPHEPQELLQVDSQDQVYADDPFDEYETSESQEETRDINVGEETRDIGTWEETRDINVGEETQEETRDINVGEETRDIGVWEKTRDIGVWEETRDVDVWELETYWNLVFQDLREELQYVQTRERQTQLMEQLSDHVTQFTDSATSTAKIIIEEIHSQHKTIPPSDSLGGEAGGTKYLHNGIIFKLCTSIIGALDFNDAMKIAGHEIKALNFIIETINTASIDAPCKKLCYPMMCMIDYLGFRILAVSRLPINSSTLRYGTADQGQHVTRDNKFDCYMKDLGMRCNLGPNHRVEGIFYTPLDMEGHAGLDYRQYILDFSRLFPPLYYNRVGNDCAYLYDLFRPELIRTFEPRNSLLSDSLSLFVSERNSKQATEMIERATSRLTSRIIPSFAFILRNQKATETSVSQLIPALHRQGINIRYIGYLCWLLRSEEEQTPWSYYLLVEMFARLTKCVLRDILKDNSSASKRKAIVHFLNSMFANSIILEECWADKFHMFESKFPSCKITESDVYELIREPQVRQAVCKRMCMLVGIEFTPIALRNIENWQFFAQENPFSIESIKNHFPMVKKLVIMDYCRGVVLKRRAKQISDVTEKKRLLMDAKIAFENAFLSNSSDIPSMLQMADIYRKLGDNERARDYFSLLMRMTNDPQVKYKCARFCHKTNAPETSQGYQQAILANFKSFKTWYHYTIYLINSNESAQTIQMCFSATFLVANEQERCQLYALIQKYQSTLSPDAMWTQIQNNPSQDVSSFWNKKLTDQS